MPGLGLARIFLWTELHVQCLLPGGKRVGGGSHQSPAPNTPAVASFEADVLCLYTAATVVLALLAVASRQALACRDTLHPTLGTLRPSLLQTVGEELAWLRSTCVLSKDSSHPPHRG